jgi:hypothetical protein
MHWSQIQTILWLRWRLTRNQWARGGRVNVVISLVVMALLLLIGVGGGVGGLLAGVFGLGDSSPLVMLGVYDVLTVAFLLFWCIGVLSTMQRSESIDIGKLLHLPISLKSVFLVNYLASHVTLSIIVFLPGMLALAAGLALGGRGMMLLLIPLILGFLFAITAWTYCLRGWLVILMKNPRRYRAVVAGITMASILLSQLPHLLNMKFMPKPRSSSESRQTQSERGRSRMLGIPPVVLLAHGVVPPLWVGNGAMALAEGNTLPALLAAAASFGIGGLGLARTYRSTRRFYEGHGDGKKARPARKERTARSGGGRLLERRLPGLSEEAGATALASWRSLTRATEVKTALASNVVMLLMFGGMAVFSRSRDMSLRVQFFYGTGIALLPFLGMIFLLTNQFGFDRTGFRTLVLSPMPRSQILLGKNLAVLPIAVVLGVVYLALATIGLGLNVIVATVAMVQLLGAFFLLSIGGNLLSSLLPYRVREGTLAATKVGAARALLNFLAHMVCMSVLSVLLLPAVAAALVSSGDGMTARLVYVVISVAELVVIAAVYRMSLPGLGELLQAREKEILRVVTQEVE